MGLFDNILGKSDRLRSPLPRSANVYYTDKMILICPVWSDVYGRTGFGSFPEIISITSSSIDMGRAVLAAVASSKSQLVSEYSGESKELSINAKKAFQAAGISGWEELEKWGLLVVVELGNGRISILSTRPCKTGGYVGLSSDQSYELGDNPRVIGMTILQIIKGNPINTYVEDEGHT